MKLRTKYLLFVMMLHIITLVLSFYIFRDNTIFFIVTEIFIIISLFISWQLYKALIRPLRMLVQGVEAMKDRDFNVKFVATGKYEMDLLIGVYNNMMDELRTERTRQEQQHFFLEKLIFTSPTGILILDYDEHLRQINPRALQLLRIPEKELTGRPIHELTHPLLQYVSRMQSGESATITVDGVNTYKLQKAHFVDRGFPRHFVMIEQLTEEILAAEKKAYGQVIRMMAHEVNNTIGPVNSILQSALESQQLAEGKSSLSLQNALQVAVQRNHNLNLFMRNFADMARLPAPVRKDIDLRRLVQQVAGLMETKAGEKQISFLYEPPGSPLLVYADALQMEQVLINIIKNAMEAIDGAGSILFVLDPASRQLTITDSGVGIDDTVAGRLFSPFFSTKKDGQGIGLTFVKEVLLNHGFQFSLETTAPGQTAFTIVF